MECRLDLVYPYQCITIDEQCCPWKGRHKCRCYNPNKPEKWHFKFYSLNCAKTAYQLDFIPYQGKAEVRVEDIPATAWPIYNLLSNENKYWNRGYVLFTDNWYTGMPSLKICQDRGIEMVGTIKANRKGLPPDPRRVRGAAKAVRGEFITKKSSAGSVYYTVWQDRKPVRMLHTIPTLRSGCLRQVKENGRWTRKEFSRPSIIPLYNHGMGGTDACDQRAQCYRPRLKTLSWIPRIFSHVLNVVVVNCYIIAVAHNFTKMSHLEFRETLVDQLAEEYQSQKILEPGSRPERPMTLKQWERQISRRTGQHFIKEMRRINADTSQNEERSKWGGTKVRNFDRRQCILCKRKVPTYCKSCEVFLCIRDNEEMLNCFERFHTCAFLLERNAHDEVFEESSSGEVTV